MSDILKQIDNFIAKYKEGITVGIPTKVSTTRGKYDALRYKKVPIEQLMTKSTESFSLIGSYKSGENSVELQSNNNINQILVNGEKIYENDNLGDALNRYYHELKNIASSQTDNTDLALQIFGDMVVEQNRKILPMLNQLGKLSEAKIFEKQWAQFGVVPLNEEKDVNTVVSRAIPAKEFSKKATVRTEQNPIIGGDVKHPGVADFGMQADVRKKLDNIIQKYEAGKEADKHKYVKKLEGDEEAPEGTYVTESKGHTYAYSKDEWGVKDWQKEKQVSKYDKQNKSEIELETVSTIPVTSDIELKNSINTRISNGVIERRFNLIKNDMKIGKIYISEKPDNISIDYIEVFTNFQRQGLATIMRDAIVNFFGKPVDIPKYLTSQGQAFRESILQKNVLLTIAQTFADKGFELYEVGGRVRDSLLGRESHDIDLSTNATPDETQAILEKLNLGTIYDVGKRFGTIGVTPKTGNSIEITTYRGETYTPGSRKPGVSFGGKLSLKDDLSRRDFTINSLARSVQDNKIVDYFGGQEDLKNKIIRAVGNPQERYAEDPLRMLRAARFAAQLDFNVDTQMLEPEKLQDISKERIASELDKILLSENPIKGFGVMKKFGLTKYVIPELDTLSGVSQQPHHANDVYEHVLEVIDNASKIKLDNSDDKHILMLSALLHDIAKPTTRTETEGKAHFYEHEKAGADKAREILTDLKYSNDIIDKVTTLIKHHMYILHTFNSADVSDKQLRRFIFSVGIENVPLLIALAKADAKSSTRTDTTFIDKLKERIKNLPQEQKQTLISPLNGDEIMEKFNIKPGRIITEIKNYLINKIVDGELNPDDKDKAYEFATNFVEENKNMINKSMDNLNDENDDSTSETVEFETEDIPNEDGTVTTNYTVKKISPYQSAVEDGESMVNNQSGVFEKQMRSSSFGAPTLSPGWIPSRQTMGKIPVRVPIKRQGKIYYGIRWKSPGEGGITYPSLKPQGHLIRPEDYLKDSLVHSTLYYGTDEETANSIFKNGFKVGTSGRFGIAFYLYTNINRARMQGKTIVMSKLYTEEVFIIAHPNADEKATQYADYIIHGLRRTLGEPQGKADIGIDWNNAFNKRGIKALAYSLNFEEDVKKDYELEIIVFTPDVLKVIADVKKNIGAEDIKKDIGEDTPNPDYNNMPKYTYGTAVVPDANIMNKQATFSAKDQQTAEVGNNQYPIKHPIGPNLDKQKPIVEK